ncbi:MAG: hypothetical protein ACXWMF_13725 [Syntrophales bacterium]
MKSYTKPCTDSSHLRLMAMFGFGMRACETADISLNLPLLS